MIDPRGMELADWCDSMSFELERLSSGSLPMLEGLDWKAWGRRVIVMLIPNQQHAPDPDQFDDWREWGARLALHLGSNS